VSVKVITGVLVFVSLVWLAFGGVYEYEHYTFKVGILQGKNNYNFTNDIVLLGFDTNIKFFDNFFGSVDFWLSFPDSRYSFLLFEPSFHYVQELLGISKVLKLQAFFWLGIQNQSEFVPSVSNTNISSFQYYYFFIPFFRVSLVAVGFNVLDLSLAWFGGYPIIFLPNTRPDWGVPVGYPSFEIGIRNVLIDRISFEYNPLRYSINLSKRF